MGKSRYVKCTGMHIFCMEGDATEHIGVNIENETYIDVKAWNADQGTGDLQNLGLRLIGIGINVFRH